MLEKSLRILLIFTILTSWLLSGWSPIWQNPRIPQKIQIAHADTTPKTYSFLSDLEGWTNTACGASGASCVWQSNDGSPANGSIEESETRKNKSGTWTWQLSGVTWEDLGVPAGATVTGVDGSYNHKMSTCISCGTSNTSGNLLIRNYGDTATIATLETEVSYSGATAWATRNASATQSIGSSYKASNTGIILRLTGFLGTPNTTGAQAILRQDEISLTITYTPGAAVSVSVSDGVITYGTIAVGTSKSTIDLTDTQTAQNDGNVTENFNIKTSNATGGTQWTIDANPGSDIFVHEFSTNGGGAWTKFTASDSYQTLATGVATSGTQNLDLRITVPSISSDYQQKSITVTIQAVQQ